MVDVEKMQDEEWEAVRAIYGEGIATSNATFETEVAEWEDWNRSHLHDCRLIAKERECIVEWAVLSPVSGRYVFAGVTEVSVYVTSSMRRRGIGIVFQRVPRWVKYFGVALKNGESRWEDVLREAQRRVMVKVRLE
jgi:L-amino acid N-acyltransferase YncA